MRTVPLLLLLAASFSDAHAGDHDHDHDEFDATLVAPYRGEAGGAARVFRINLAHPHAAAPYGVDWRFELASLDGRTRQSWRGVQQLGGDRPVTIDVAWNGRFGAQPAFDGIYRATLVAGSVEQAWEIAVGAVPSAPPPSNMAPAPAPWRIVLGNLHSQTGHSDGGGPLASCDGAQAPQSSPLGPAAAFDYADSHGLDFLVASEHNHLYDGSTATNGAADPRAVRALYQAGLAAAAAYNGAHPGFVGIYATEWGVIDKGGHLNIFNAPGLPGWETNSAGDLLADVATPRGDYAALYATMRQRGWIGQFNHPAPKGQFVIDEQSLAYTVDGDAAMVLCEVLNTHAFSTSDTESETRHSTYENACRQLLEAGYHVALSSNQDNHCANWGMSSANRTGVLLRAGETFSQAALFEALRARRVFATMDKESTLLLTANGHVMGERFSNRGPLELQVRFFNSTGRRAASLLLVDGVPGRNGAVSETAVAFDTTVTPTPGEHFYYVRVTQDDGKLLWSAPVWVSQQGQGAARR